MSLYIGADPGLKGALALLDSYGELLEVADMPVTGKHVSVQLLADIVGGWTDEQGEPPVFVIEDVHSTPQMGVTSAFSFGRSKGVLEATAAAYQLPIIYVSPAVWKRDMKVKKEKGHARQRAMNMWPGHSDLFKRVKDDGRAEAAIIGAWGITHGT